MAKNDYENWDKKALIAEIAALKRRKKFGLVWEDKPEAVVDRCRSELPVLEEVKSLALNSADGAPTNLLIEGDNYHALAVLNYTHKGKIDVIYIDPPYNTGARDWKYNNDFVDKNDGCRHSKWLSMMAHRFALVKNLLSASGIICITIDHNELFTLGCLCDELLGEDNRLGIISVLINPRGRQFSSFFSSTMEFYLVYAKNKNSAAFNQVAIDEAIRASFVEKDEHGRFRWESFVRLANIEDKLKNRQSEYSYPIYVSQDLKHITPEKKSGYHRVLPQKNGELRCWKIQRSSFAYDLADDDSNYKAFCENGDVAVQRKYREQQFFTTHWVDKKYNSTFFGTRLLESMIGKGKFDYPKSLYAVMDFLKIASPKNGVVLDFFAGSGTTGHAVSLLNKEDGGERRFILCTNNESGIAREVCYPRIKAVIKGHENLPDITGIASNLRYFKTAFVAAAPTDPNKIRLTQKAADMICVKEGTFAPVKETKAYKIFREDKRYTAIVYDDAAIPQIKKFAAKTDGKFVAYIFSFGDDDYADEFADMRDKIQTRAIPEAILRVYRRIFGKREQK